MNFILNDYGRERLARILKDLETGKESKLCPNWVLSSDLYIEDNPCTICGELFPRSAPAYAECPYGEYTHRHLVRKLKTILKNGGA